MARPGEVREVLRSVFASSGPTSWRSAAELGQVGYDCARRTVENMVQAGELVRCGEEKPPGAQAWRGLYELQDPFVVMPSLDAEPSAHPGLDDLAAVTASWAAFE